jgi:hypothetical protein
MKIDLLWHKILDIGKFNIKWIVKWIMILFLNIFFYRKRLKNQAKREAKQKWDDRHWKDKPVEEMVERDWRIFKEDFNIACKGGRIPNPIRDWNESDLTDDVRAVIDKVGYKVGLLIRLLCQGCYR